MRFHQRYLLAILVLLGLCTKGRAQQIIFQESFELISFPPTGWAIVNDGAGANFTSVSNAVWAYDGLRSMTYQGNGNPNNANAWAITPAVALNTNPVYISFYVRARTNIASEKLRFTVGTGGGTANQTTVLLDSSNINYTTYRKWTVVFTPGAAGSHYFGFNCVSDGFSGALHIDSVTFRQEFLACTGTPSGGTAVSNIGSVCNNTTTFNLSVNGGTTQQSSLSYQWQQSVNNSTWTNIAGATDATLSAQTVNATTWYRRQITCGSSGGGTASSTAVQVSFSGPVYGTLPINESFDDPWQNSCAIRDRPGPNWRNGVATGNTSWRRSDDGASGAWNGPAIGAYTPEASEGTTSARFHSTQAFNQTGELQLYVNASGNTTKRLQFDYINILNFTQFDSLRVWISTDGGATSNPVGTVMTSANSWISQTIDLNINSATTIIYFRTYATGNTGGTDIGLDNIRFAVLTSCTGTPNPGVLSVTPSGCGSNINFNFTVAGATSGVSGLSYQWQQSQDSSTWTNIAGATGESYLYPNPTTAIYVRRVTFCGANSDNTAGRRIEPSSRTYASLPVTEDFEGPWINGCSIRDLPSGLWTNIPSSGNTSWRRNDDGAAGNWTGLGSGSYNPASTSGNFSARFHSWDARQQDGPGNLDLYVNTAVAGQKRLRFNYINQDGTDTLGVLISTDGGANFMRLAAAPLGVQVGWQQFEYTFNANSATTVIRFAGRGDFGNSDIGLDRVELINLAPCSGTPNAGTVNAATNECATLPIRLGISGASVGFDLGFQWQQSANGSTGWTNVIGATGDSLFLPASAAGTYYRRSTRCGTDSAFSTSILAPTLSITSVYATLPYFEGFESTWQSVCANSERPGASWRNQPVTGNASWRRNESGTTANWTNAFNGTYFPNSVQGSFSARFHSSVASGQVGNLDVYIDGSTGGDEKRVRFNHNNTNGGDSLVVLVSTNGGSSFTRLLGITSNTSGWRGFNTSFISSSSQIVLRFAAYGDGVFASDIGLDSVSITAPPNCSGTPAAATITGPDRVCDGFNFTLTATGFQPMNSVGGKFYQWQANTGTGSNWTNLINANNPASVNVVQNVPTRYRLVDSCAFSGQVAISNEWFVTRRPDTASYFALSNSGYAQSFENWQSRCVSTELPDTFWLQSTLLGDSAWRRNDQGASAGWTNGLNGTYIPVSTTGNFSARFHSKNGSFQRYRGRMDFYVNAAGNPQLEIGFRYQNILDNDSLNVWVSTNGGQSFFRIGALGSQPFASNFSSRRFFLGNPTARTIVRLEGVSASFDEGGTDIAIDSFYLQPRSCPVPSGLAYNRAANAASWQSVSGGNFLEYKWELRTSGAPGSGALGLFSTATTSSLLATFGTLPLANYTFYLRSNCAADSSVWTSVSFNSRVNDECSQPRQLTVNTVGAPLNVLTDSTNISGGTNFGCNFAVPTVNDVFFRFTAPAGVNQVIVRVNNRQLIGAGSAASLFYQVYQQSGNCPIPTGSSFGCFTQDSVTLFVSPGVVYLVRVFSEPPTNTPSFQNHKFDISVSQPPPPPACTQNVSPANNATGVPIDNVVLRWRKAEYATAYDVYAAGPIATSPFYNFVSTVNNGDTSYNIPIQLQTNSTYRFYVVPTNAQGSSTACFNNFTSFTTDAGPAPPGNDECNTAALYTLPISSVGYDTSTLTTFSTIGATTSSNNNTCYSGNDDDVWFSFIATSTAHVVRIVRVAGTTVTPSITVYSGGCAGPSLLTCTTGDQTSVSGLTIGQRYTVRVYTPFTATLRLSGFKIAITAVPPPPANDDCGNAITLTGAQAVTGTTYGGTFNSGPGSPFCNSTSFTVADDVWYRFVPLVSGAATINITNTGPSTFDLVAAVYSGSNCNLLSFVTCTNAAGVGANETVSLTGLIAGNTYYLRVFSNNQGGNITGGNFTLVYNGSTLPVQLSQFTGTVQPAANLLNWTTQSEANNKGFGVELSLDGGRNFRQLGFVETKAGSGGNSHQPLSYQFSHEWKAQGLSAQRMWYRLVQTDFNGRTTYSKVVELATKTDGKQLLISTVYPNPAKDLVQVKLEGNTQQVRGALLVVSDMAGRIVVSQPVADGAVQQTVQLRKLAPGNYLIRLNCADGCTSPAVSLRKD